MVDRNIVGGSSGRSKRCQAETSGEMRKKEVGKASGGEKRYIRKTKGRERKRRRMDERERTTDVNGGGGGELEGSRADEKTPRNEEGHEQKKNPCNSI